MTLSSIKLPRLFSSGTIETGNFMANVTVISHINKLCNFVCTWHCTTTNTILPQTLFNLTPPKTNLWHPRHRRDNIYRRL